MHRQDFKATSNGVSALFILSLSALIELDIQFVCVKVGNWFMKDAFCDFELTLVNQDAILFISFYLLAYWGLRKWANTEHA